MLASVLDPGGRCAKESPYDPSQLLPAAVAEASASTASFFEAQLRSILRFPARMMLSLRLTHLVASMSPRFDTR
jgi:hypothetical protein